jgi:glycosyltransferase involved in cell wall biosynthesis
VIVSNSKPQFIFVLLSKFPTTRAYGVTTELSALTVRKFGYYSLIVTPKLGEYPPSGNEIIEIAPKIRSVLLTNYLSKFLIIRFNFFLMIYPLIIRFKFLDKNVVFWTRDIILAFLLSTFSKKLTICEIHRTPRGFQLIVLKLLSRKKNVILAPISNFLENKIILNSHRTVIAHMAINKEEIIETNSIKAKRYKKIIYVGNPNNGAVPLQIDLLNDAAGLVYKKNPDWIFEIVGISEEVFLRSCSKYKSPNIKFLEHLPRKLVIKKLRSSLIGLVIYPNLQWFHDSFPIKIVEYSASGVAIVASDTIAHRRILSKNRCVYFKSGSAVSLANGISQLINNEAFRVEVIKNSLVWVKDLTYEKRVTNIISVVNKLNKT